MCTTILATKSGAFVLSTQLETDRGELPKVPQGFFGGPPVEEYKLPPKGYRTHRRVFLTLQGVLEVLPDVLAKQPSEWELAQVSTGGPLSVGANPLAQGSQFVMVRKIDEGFLVESGVERKKNNPKEEEPKEEEEQKTSKKTILRVSKRQVEDETVYEIQTDSPFLSSTGPGQFMGLPAVYGAEAYAFVGIGDVVSFLTKHLESLA